MINQSFNTSTPQVRHINLPISRMIIGTIFSMKQNVKQPPRPLYVNFIFNRRRVSLTIAMRPTVTRHKIIDLGRAMPAADLARLRHKLNNPNVPQPNVTRPRNERRIRKFNLETTVNNQGLSRHVLKQHLNMFRHRVGMTIFNGRPHVRRLGLELVTISATVFNRRLPMKGDHLKMLMRMLRMNVTKNTIRMRMMLFSVLTIITFTTHRTGRPLLRGKINAIPRNSHGTRPLVIIEGTNGAIFAPTMNMKTHLIIKSRVPNFTHNTVIFTRYTPLTLARMQPPALPVNNTVFVLNWTGFFNNNRKFVLEFFVS